MSRDVKINNSGNTEQKTGEVVLVEGKEATGNRGRIAINWQLGEALYALDFGIDYAGILAEKDPDTDLLTSQIRNRLLLDPAIEDVESIDIDVNRDTRSATITVTAIADEDEEIQIKSDLEV